jgi:hypothetical protein
VATRDQRREFSFFRLAVFTRRERERERHDGADSDVCVLTLVVLFHVAGNFGNSVLVYVQLA